MSWYSSSFFAIRNSIDKFKTASIIVAIMQTCSIFFHSYYMLYFHQICMKHICNVIFLLTVNSIMKTHLLLPFEVYNCIYTISSKHISYQWWRRSSLYLSSDRIYMVSMILQCCKLRRWSYLFIFPVLSLNTYLLLIYLIRWIWLVHYQYYPICFLKIKSNQTPHINFNQSANHGFSLKNKCLKMI